MASLATVGVYMLYWLYATRAELSGEGYDTPSMKVLLYPLLALLGLVVAVVPIDMVIRSGQGRHLIDLILFPALTIAFSLSEVVLGVWWLWQFCGVTAKYVENRFTQASTFWLFILLAVIGAGWMWPGVLQGYLNTQYTARR